MIRQVKRLLILQKKTQDQSILIQKNEYQKKSIKRNFSEEIDPGTLIAPEEIPEKILNKKITDSPSPKQQTKKHQSSKNSKQINSAKVPNKPFNLDKNNFNTTTKSIASSSIDENMYKDFSDLLIDFREKFKEEVNELNDLEKAMRDIKFTLLNESGLSNISSEISNNAAKKPPVVSKLSSTNSKIKKNYK